MLFDYKTTYDEAIEKCQNLSFKEGLSKRAALHSSELAVITSQDEQNFINGKVWDSTGLSKTTNNNAYWIGLEDREEEGRMVWINSGSKYGNEVDVVGHENWGSV